MVGQICEKSLALFVSMSLWFGIRDFDQLCSWKIEIVINKDMLGNPFSKTCFWDINKR